MNIHAEILSNNGGGMQPPNCAGLRLAFKPSILINFSFRASFAAIFHSGHPLLQFLPFVPFLAMTLA